MRVRDTGRMLAALLFTATVTVAAEELRVSSFQANIRSSPSRKAEVMVTLKRGDVLALLGRSGSWYKVRIASTGVEGYVHATMVERTGASGTPSRVEALRVTAPRAEVRAEPSSRSDILVTLEQGAVVEWLERRGQWHRVRDVAHPFEGYVHASMVEPASESLARVAAPRVAPAPEIPREAAPSAPAEPESEPEPRPPAPSPRPPVAAPPVPPPPPPPVEAPEEPRLGLRGFGQGGYVFFNAGDSFRTVLGEASGPSFGGGVEVRYRRFFLQVGVERIRKTGERVFVFEGEVFPLGIENTVTLTPVSAIVGYRFLRLGRVTLLAGAGIGSYGFEEEFAFADTSDVVSERFTSYHGLVGGEVAVNRWLAVRAEAQYASVPDAIGFGGVSELFGETNLGGATVRIKILAGR